MKKLVISALSPLIIFAVAFFVSAHELEIRGEIQHNTTNTNIMQNSTIDKFKMKSYFENAIKEVDKGNIVGVHQELELAKKQLDSTQQIQAVEPHRESAEQEEEEEYENESEGYESLYEQEHEDY